MSELKEILTRNIVFPHHVEELLKASIIGISPERLEQILNENYYIFPQDKERIRQLLKQQVLSTLALVLILEKLQKGKKVHSGVTNFTPYNLPPPKTPSGTPPGTPPGTLSGTLSGTPSGTPSGAPSGAPSGVPYTPSGVPYGTPSSASSMPPVTPVFLPKPIDLQDTGQVAQVNNLVNTLFPFYNNPTLDKNDVDKTITDEIKDNIKTNTKNIVYYAISQIKDKDVQQRIFNLDYIKNNFADVIAYMKVKGEILSGGAHDIYYEKYKKYKIKYRTFKK